ncbi:MAG: hypothetical protein ACOC2U_02520, partial [bacterium]
MAKLFKISTDEISKKMEEQEKPKFEKDERFYIPERDKDGNFRAKIRFLTPILENGKAGLPRVQEFSHAFKSRNGRFFNEICPTTIHKECPICLANKPYWEENKDTARVKVGHRSRKNYFISNILVIEDSTHPENEGKVFIYKYPKTIKQFQDEYKTDEGKDFFCPNEGAVFRLKIWTKTDGERKYPQYDKSQFESPSPLCD